jgi:hypothetical protein
MIFFPNLLIITIIRTTIIKIIVIIIISNFTLQIKLIVFF